MSTADALMLTKHSRHAIIHCVVYLPLLFFSLTSLIRIRVVIVIIVVRVVPVIVVVRVIVVVEGGSTASPGPVHTLRKE